MSTASPISIIFQFPSLGYISLDSLKMEIVCSLVLLIGPSLIAEEVDALIVTGSVVLGTLDHYLQPPPQSFRPYRGCST